MCHPNRSSSAPPLPLFDPPPEFINACPPPEIGFGGDGALVAPQIPALAFSLAMLARFGPGWFAFDALGFLTPALAVDQREPKASPEPDAVVGLLVDVDEMVDGPIVVLACVVREAEFGCRGEFAAAETEVK